MTPEQAAAVATLRDQLSNGCAMDCWQEISHLLAALDAAQATVAKWETALSAVMPADFKDWHQNSRTEWPELAAWVIVNLREREAEAWKHVDRIVAQAQNIPPPDDPPIPDPREETKRALIAWAVAYGRTVAAAQAPRDVPRLTDDDIDTCIPVADGSAEVNVRRVEVLPGVMGQEYEEAAAWSLPLVRQISRAVEARVRELCGVAP